MYNKAKIFHDEEIAQEILNAKDPTTVKRLGRKVSNYNDVIWNGRRQIILYKGLMNKFTQNQDLKEMLLVKIV